ncbi:hypothetical protein [Deinococcus ficus]|uniref:Uncharacterized protein n=1 Tax=Deinococcus ficus TaxID=317577 RepID=A0A221T186_9DEIO|nr:hypothetical protein [Deinococcus ficus]ASN82636.1 hypothetical protein DFI_15820 [Deinococcus ficus]
MILNRLAREHFPHLPPSEGRAAVIRLLDALDRDTLAAARVERHHGTGRSPIRESGGVAARSG